MGNINTMTEQSAIKKKKQKTGLSVIKIVLPTLTAFITWALIAVLFSPSGLLPDITFSSLHESMIIFLLPLLLAYLSGHLVYKKRGAVTASVVIMGAIVSRPAKPVALLAAMLIIAMVFGAISAFCMKKIDAFLEDKIPVGFEMLVNNYSIGILGFVMTLIAFMTMAYIGDTINLLI